MNRVGTRLSIRKNGRWINFSEGTEVDGNPEVVIRISHSIHHPTNVERLIINQVCATMPSGYESLAWERNRFPWAEILMRHGRTFDPGIVSHEEFSRGFQEEDMRPWCCFYNSVRMARNHGLQYAEGFAVSPSGPMFHAWNVREGKAIDYTWPATHLNRYFGMIFDIDWLNQIGCPDGGIFYDWPKNQTPLETYLAETPEISILTHCVR